MPARAERRRQRRSGRVCLVTYEYAHIWQIKGNNSPSNYTWYVKKTDGTTQAWGTATDTATHSVGVPFNTYRMGAQTHSGTPQNWTVCYTDS